MLIAQYRIRPPTAEEAGRENAVSARTVAVEIIGALPGQECGEMRRLHRRDAPLAGGIVGNAEQADLAVRPGLHAGPFDRIVEIAELFRRVRRQPPRRFAGATAVDLDDDVSVGNEAFGVG